MAPDRGEKIVGVIGGMGPEATVDFMRRLVARTPARDDADHLHVLVDNNPKIPVPHRRADRRHWRRPHARAVRHGAGA